jgi:hypothetical protein
MSVKYAVVFDLDETLGYFTQVGRFWDLTKFFLNKRDLADKYFFSILDAFDNILRPKILDILKSIKKKKKQKICDFVMIYTNNNGPNSWADLIQSYFHYKLNYKLFDRIIRAYQIDGRQVEMSRSSHDKSFKDLLSCTNLPPNTKVCFLDDKRHKEMQHENVIYIKLKPYKCYNSFKEMGRFFYATHRSLFNASLDEYLKFILANTNSYKYDIGAKSKTECNIDQVVSNKMFSDVKKFFKTIKRKPASKNARTQKKKKRKKFARTMNRR